MSGKELFKDLYFVVIVVTTFTQIKNEIPLPMELTKEALEQTTSIEDAVKKLFGISMQGRSCILRDEAIVDGPAEAYARLGCLHRQKTYNAIADDFLGRVEYLGHSLTNDNDKTTMLDVGCGPGLLLRALETKTQAQTTRLVGLDISPDMVNLARMNTLPSSMVREGSVYSLLEIVQDIAPVDYIVCRNVLHRLRDPQSAIREMYTTVSSGGAMYLRDLRRDADWKTVVERIGEERWKEKRIVEDYIKAMAAMLTMTELQHMIQSLGIQRDDYILEEGRYQQGKIQTAFKEYETEVEYVCVIQK